MLILAAEYLPSIEYVARLIGSGDNYIIDCGEHYIKRSARNRARIMTANGTLWNELLKTEEQTKQAVAHLMQEMMKDNPPPKNNTSLEWVKHMNWLKRTAEEIVLPQMIYN